MGSISIEYDEEKGELRVESDVKLEMPIIPALQKSSKESAKILEDLVDLGSSSVRVVLEPAEDVLESVGEEEG